MVLTLSEKGSNIGAQAVANACDIIEIYTANGGTLLLTLDITAGTAAARSVPLSTNVATAAAGGTPTYFIIKDAVPANIATGGVAPNGQNPATNFILADKGANIQAQAIANASDIIRIYTTNGGTLLLTLDITAGTAAARAVSLTTNVAAAVATGTPTYFEILDNVPAVIATGTVSTSAGSGDLKTEAGKDTITSGRSYNFGVVSFTLPSSGTTQGLNTEAGKDALVSGKTYSFGTVNYTLPAA